MIISAHDPDLTTHLLDQGYTRRILAEGDSWFSLGGYFNGNLLHALDTQTGGELLIVNCAYPGDEVRYMAHIAADSVVGSNLALFNGWDALLLSGGGNDVMARIPEFVDARGVDTAVLALILHEVRSAYLAFVRLRNLHAPAAPILCHNYDLPRPTAGRRLLQPGPWIGARLKEVGLPRYLWQDVARQILNALDQALNDVRSMAANFHIMPTLGTLDGSVDRLWRRGSWENEIHPSALGYNRLAAKCVPVLTEVLGLPARVSPP